MLEIVHKENPVGMIVQYGGQTPLKLARALEANGVSIIGTSPESIDVAEDRERFQKLLNKLGLRQPPNRTARTEAEALAHASEIGYPLVVRPSYVLGGRAMEIVHEQQDLERYMREAVKVSNDSPVLLDRFLNDATEVDVDCLADGQTVFIGGVMEHIEQAGVHSGDSACSLPPYSLSAEVIAEIKRQTTMMAKALNVSGLMNVQFAIQGGDVYVLEVNPRASRTVPYVSKATGLQLAKIAARAMAGRTLADQGITREVVPPYFSVKEAVFPFVKFPGVDTILGPEMKSTGEVMGVGNSFGEAFVKSQLAAGVRLPDSGTVFISVRNQDKPRAVEVARGLHNLGFKLVATRGTAAEIEAAGIPVQVVNKVTEGRPHIVDMVKNGEVSLVINTVEERRNAIADSRTIRTQALANRITFFTTIAGARRGGRHAIHAPGAGPAGLPLAGAARRADRAVRRRLERPPHPRRHAGMGFLRLSPRGQAPPHSQVRYPGADIRFPIPGRQACSMYSSRAPAAGWGRHWRGATPPMARGWGCWAGARRRSRRWRPACPGSTAAMPWTCATARRCTRPRRISSPIAAGGSMS